LARKTEVLGELVNVYVHRNEQLRRVHVPHAEIDPVGWANHPTEKQQQPLAAAGAARVRQEVCRATARTVAPETPGGSDRIA
jgi:hypothetical protein